MIDLSKFQIQKAFEKLRQKGVVFPLKTTLRTASHDYLIEFHEDGSYREVTEPNPENDQKENNEPENES